MPRWYYIRCGVLPIFGFVQLKCREIARQYVFINRKAGFSLSIPLLRPMVTTDGHNSAFYLTNARELQDVPGEWYHDIDARKIYYYPREGEKMQEAKVIVPAVETLVRVEGTVDRPVCHIRFEKITFPILHGCVRQKKDMYLFRQVCI